MAETVTTINELKLRRLTKTVLDNKQTVNANELLLVDPEFTGGKLLSTDNAGNMVESAISSADVSDAVTKKHAHSNKTILDLIPDTLGTAGQSLVVNSGATGLEFSTVGGGGSSTLEGLTDTNISSPVDGQMLKYDNSSSKWINANVPTEIPTQTGNSGKFLTTNGSAVSWVNAPTELPTITGNASKILAVNSGATGVEWITNSGGGGFTNYDFTPNTKITHSSSSTTESIVFAANTQGTQWIDTSVDLDMSIACNNDASNYILVNNTGNSDIAVTITGVTHNGTSVTVKLANVDNGEVSVGAGKCREFGILRYSDAYIITNVEL
jgi:hypothetical protein